MRKNSLGTLVLLLLLFPAWGEEPAAEPDVREKASTEGAKAEGNAAPSAAPRNAGEFDPSEEIAEDFSVPFPVDI